MTRRRFARTVDRVEERLPPWVSDAVERLRDEDVLLFAASLGFYALVSIAPFLVVGFWLTGLVAGEQWVESLAERVAPVETGEGDVDVQRYVEDFLTVGAGAGITALLFALWPATAYGGGIVRALDAVAVDRDPQLYGLRGRARALVVLGTLPVVLVGGLVVGYLVTTVVDDGVLRWVLIFVAGVAATTAGVMALYWWFGNVDLSLRALAAGALVASTGMTAMSFGYLLYAGGSNQMGERLLGAGFGTALALGLWLYLANLLLLVGYCAALALDVPEGVHPGTDEADGR